MSDSRIYALLERLQDIAAQGLDLMSNAELLRESVKDGHDVKAEVSALRARIEEELRAYELRLGAQDGLHAHSSISEPLLERPAEEDTVGRDALDDDIAELDLARAAIEVSASADWSPEKVDAAALEYRCFLQCLRDFPDEVITPSRDCERFWRCHAQCGDLYRRQTRQLFGHPPQRPREHRMGSAAARPGMMRALVIATGRYDDPRLSALSSSSADAAGLRQVLGDHRIGNYTVTICQDESCDAWRTHIAEFFASASSEQQLLLYISGHAVKDTAGELYFAAKDTRLDLLSATGIPASFVQRHSERSAARGVLTLLDTCFSGAFGTSAGASEDPQSINRHWASSAGRVVMSASDAMQHALAAESPGKSARPSLFSRYVIEGLRTGEADLDDDGQISSRDLYEYVLARMSAARVLGPRPQHWASGLDTDLIVASRLRRETYTPMSIDSTQDMRIEQPVAKLGAPVAAPAALKLGLQVAPVAGLPREQNRAFALQRAERTQSSGGFWTPMTRSEPAVKGTAILATAASLAVLAVGATLVGVWHQPHLLGLPPAIKLGAVQAPTDARAAGALPAPERANPNARPDVTPPPQEGERLARAAAVASAAPARALNREPPAPLRPSSRRSAVATVAPRPAEPALVFAQHAEPPIAPAAEGNPGPAPAVGLASPPASTPEVRPLGAPGPDGPLSPLEKEYAITVGRIIRARSVVPDSPEFQAELLKGKEVVVSFELDRRGRVSQVFVDRPSGSRVLDKLAKRIVSGASYPPFPEGAWPGAARHVFATAMSFR